MDHKLFRSKISEYIDKKLQGKALAEFDKHAKECPACLLELQMTVKAVTEMKKSKSSKEIELPGNFYAKLGNGLDKADAEKLKRKSFIYTPWFRAAALSFALILTVVMVRQITKSPEYIGNKGFDKNSAIVAEEASAPAPAPATAGLAQAEKEELKLDKAAARKTAAKKKAIMGAVLKAPKPMAMQAKAAEQYKFEEAKSTAAGAEASEDNAPAAEPMMEAAPQAAAAAPERAMALDAAKDEKQVVKSKKYNPSMQGMVIKDEKVWSLCALENVPKPDFTKQMVLYVSLGTRMTAGYSVEFTEIKYGNDKITVYVKAITPKPGEFTAQVITRPSGIKVIDRSDLPVEFVFVK